MPVSDRVGDVVPHVVGAHLDGRRESLVVSSIRPKS
jgi:hypothetical protein